VSRAIASARARHGPDFVSIRSNGKELRARFLEELVYIGRIAYESKQIGPQETLRFESFQQISITWTTQPDSRTFRES
jgi:hypothetical protein